MNNEEVIRFLGVDKWHNAGYTGKRGLTATTEALDGSDDHAKNTLIIFKLIAPDRKVIRLRTGSTIINGSLHNRLVEDSIPEIIKQKVDTLYSSEVVDNYCDVQYIDDSLFNVKDFCNIFYAIDNKGNKGYSKITESKYIFGVGAYYIMAGTNEMRPAYFSSVSEYVDFVAPTLINNFSGTSCSTPCLCGMAALVNDMAIEKIGRPLSQNEMYKFLKSCSIDIGDEGKDAKTGFGAPILPDPEKVNIFDFLDEEADNEKMNANFKQCDSSNYSEGRTSQILWIVLHYTANNGDTAKNNADYFARQAGIKASAHYFVDANEIWQSVKDSDTAWHCGTSGTYYNSCRNANSIGIEMVSRIDDNGNYYIEDGVVEKARELVKYLMGRYNIPTSRVCRHYDVTHKECPEPWVRNPSLFTNFIKSLEAEDLTTAEVQALIEKSKPTRYQKVSEMPEYYRKDIQEMIDNGIIKGVGDNKLDLTEDMIRTLIMNWRMSKNKEG